MYSTKLINKMTVKDNAYITVGDPFVTANPNPFRQPKKLGKDEKGPVPMHIKQIPQNAENGHFAKIEYAPEGFKEVNKYITTQPLESRKNGFGTKDAHRRDEFSNAVRTEQYREGIAKEKFMMTQHSGQVKEKLTALLAERSMRDHDRMKDSLDMEMSGTVNYNTVVCKYDIGRSRITEFNPKATKDTYYNFDNEREKRFGDVPKPVSYNIGDNAWNTKYKPPSHGGKSEVKNFFDKSHLSIAPY